MLRIEQSSKLQTVRRVDQSILISGSYVLIRVLREAESYTIMTATASEDSGILEAYPELDKLVSVAKGVFRYGKHHIDRFGRPYFCIKGIDSFETVHRIANTIAKQLGLPAPVKARIDEVLLTLYNECRISDDDEPVYLSDGMYVTSCGQLQEGY